MRKPKVNKIADWLGNNKIAISLIWFFSIATPCAGAILWGIYGFWFFLVMSTLSVFFWAIVIFVYTNKVA